MPTRPEAAMLHMQHAHVVSLLARQQEARRLKAERDALAKARRAASTAAGTAAAEQASARSAPTLRVPGPRAA